MHGFSGFVKSGISGVHAPGIWRECVCPTVFTILSACRGRIIIKKFNWRTNWSHDLCSLRLRQAAVPDDDVVLVRWWKWWEIELSSCAPEPNRSAIVRTCGILGGVEGTQPFPPRTLGVAYLRGPFSPRSLAHTSVVLLPLPLLLILHPGGFREEEITAEASRYEAAWAGFRDGEVGEWRRGDDRRGSKVTGDYVCESWYDYCLFLFRLKKVVLEGG